MHLSLKSKILMLALVPVVAFAVLQSGASNLVLDRLANSETDQIRERLLADSRDALQAYMQIALGAVQPLYDQAQDGDLNARSEAIKLLSKIKYRNGTYFYGLDSNYVRLFRGDSPLDVGVSLADRRDASGRFINREQFQVAKDGSHYVEYSSPLAGNEGVSVPKLAYTYYLPRWDMAVGTSMSLEGIDRQVDAAREQIQQRTKTILMSILMVAAALLVIVGIVGWSISNACLKPLRQIRANLDDIAEGEGDLTRRLQVDTRDEVGQLADAFNRFVGKIQRLVLQVTASTERLSILVEQVSEQTQRTELTVERQRQETDQIATAVNEMSAAAQEVARSAQQAAEAASNTDVQGRSTRQIVGSSVSRIQSLVTDIRSSSLSVDKLQQDVQSIVGVLDVIRSIADQTNLLALNAAIEAARAGEAGRGFAVVADEVRALAKRTQVSTGEIQQMIDRLQRATRDTVQSMRRFSEAGEITSEQAGKANTSLDAIADLIGVINAMNAQIASASEEQTAAAEEINININKIACGVDSAASETRIGAANARELSEVGSHLNFLARQFRV
ncbi:methyl-accepting chemotaxis protein [Pseudomonas oryzihabitans]|nr:methyl-accepting chemotaxis protein [Pseudomonas oryzihabitans]MDK8264918.1 methyl-accepting chemotaxis protein [Pseudomonas oryzihabitans]